MTWFKNLESLLKFIVILLANNIFKILKIHTV